MKTSSQGFTLIELLIVIVIMSALSAIALPAFLSQINKAASREAMVLLSSLMRQEQEYFVENNSFSVSLSSEVKLSTPELENYQVILDRFENHQTANGEKVSGLRLRAVPQKDSLNYVMGKVWIADDDVQTVLCEADKTGPFMASKTFCPN
ncbi:MAG: prepilin-type N-terminal cleavage/methylation domain-containing protein [Cyanobacteria bacterium P01_C01_bin.120]